MSSSMNYTGVVLEAADINASLSALREGGNKTEKPAKESSTQDVVMQEKFGNSQKSQSTLKTSFRESSSSNQQPSSSTALIASSDTTKISELSKEKSGMQSQKERVSISTSTEFSPSPSIKKKRGRRKRSGLPSNSDSEDSMGLNTPSPSPAKMKLTKISDFPALDPAQQTPSPRSRSPRNSNSLKVYNCKGCSYTTNIRTSFHRHISFIIGYKPFKCNYCKMKFPDLSQTTHHLKLMHQNMEHSYSVHKVADIEQRLDRYIGKCTKFIDKCDYDNNHSHSPNKFRNCQVYQFDMFKDIAKERKRQSSKKGMAEAGDTGEFSSSDSENNAQEKPDKQEKKNQKNQTQFDFEALGESPAEQPSAMSSGDTGTQAEIWKSPLDSGKKRRGRPKTNKRKLSEGSDTVIEQRSAEEENIPKRPKFSDAGETDFKTDVKSSREGQTRKGSDAFETEIDSNTKNSEDGKFIDGDETCSSKEFLEKDNSMGNSGRKKRRRGDDLEIDMINQRLEDSAMEEDLNTSSGHSRRKDKKRASSLDPSRTPVRPEGKVEKKLKVKKLTEFRSQGEVSTAREKNTMQNHIRKKYKEMNKKKMNFVTKQENESNKGGMICCPFCMYQSSSINGIRMHAFWTHRMCKYVCCECEYSSVHRWQVQEHINIDHLGKSVQIIRNFSMLSEVEDDLEAGALKGSPTKFFSVKPQPSADTTTHTLASEESDQKKDGNTKETKKLQGEEDKANKTEKDDKGQNIFEKFSMETTKAQPGSSVVSSEMSETPSKKLANTCRNIIGEVNATCHVCGFKSSCRGVGRHMLFRHGLCEYYCSICSFPSLKKIEVIKHLSAAHASNLQRAKVKRRHMLVKPDKKVPESSLVKSEKQIKGTKAMKNPKKYKVYRPQKKTVSPVVMDTQEPEMVSVEAKEQCESATKKRGRSKAKTEEQLLPIVPASIKTPANLKSTFVLHPRRMDNLQVAFSCVYCSYAAPLRHQLRLHCYDKHTNNPACLMEFHRRRDGKQEASLAYLPSVEGKENSMGKIVPYARPSHSAGSSTDISHHREESSEREEKENFENVLAVLPSSSFSSSNAVEQSMMPDLNRMDIDDNIQSNPYLDSTDSYTIGEVDDGDETSFNIKRRTNGFLSHGFNPMLPLVKRLSSSHVRIPDFFQCQTLDDIDIFLAKCGVRTLHMDMLTRKQFASFLKKFGNELTKT